MKKLLVCAVALALAGDAVAAPAYVGNWQIHSCGDLYDMLNITEKAWEGPDDSCEFAEVMPLGGARFSIVAECEYEGTPEVRRVILDVSNFNVLTMQSENEEAVSFRRCTAS